MLTAFLLSVGLGYMSAMVQLHMQHSDRDGSPMPTVENVVAVFAGKKWQKGEGEAERPVSRLEAVISGDPKASDLTSKNMTPAFFALDEAQQHAREGSAERQGERLALIAWINAPPNARKNSYDDDSFTLPEGADRPAADRRLQGRPRGGEGAASAGDRCVRCHRPGGEKSDIPFTTLEQLNKYMPMAAHVPPGGGWVDSGRQMSLEKLTQSTHAHLLSFAVLFAMTGLVFAFTSYPGVVRGVVGPLVLVAQVADVSCWWLAREPGCGQYFAMCIVGTGGVVGLGLMAQILLGLFDMYGPKGKLVLLLLFGLAGAGGGLAFVKVVGPFLKNEQDERAAAKAAANGGDKPPAPQDVPAPTGPSALEKVLRGAYPAAKWGKGEGGMVPAFFERDGADFKRTMKGATDDEKKQLAAEREGERLALAAWVKTAADARKAAYEADRFPLPADLSGRPLTAEYKADDTSVKVRTLLTDRCARCHAAGAEKEEIPLDTHEGLLKQLGPAKAGGGIPMAE